MSVNTHWEEVQSSCEPENLLQFAVIWISDHRWLVRVALECPRNLENLCYIALVVLWSVDHNIYAYHWNSYIYWTKLNKVLSSVAGGVTKLSNETLYQQQNHLQRPKPSTTDLNDRAMQHPLCTHNTSAYVGQTAKMYCCLARLDRDLSVSDLFIFNHWFPNRG